MRYFGKAASSPFVGWLRSLTTIAALALSVLVWTDEAEARLEGVVAGGASRSVQAFALPQTEPLAPDAPQMRDDEQLAANPAQPGSPGGSLGDLFSRPNMLGGFAAGFLGAGVLGLVFGRGLYTELGAPTSFLGLACQLALIVMLMRVIWAWWHGGRDPGFAGLSPRQLADVYGRHRHEMLPDADAPALDAGEPDEIDTQPEKK